MEAAKTTWKLLIAQRIYTGVVHVQYKCYVCHKLFSEKHIFLGHVKQHGPADRSTADVFHESAFTMKLPTESTMNCLEALKLFREGNQFAPPAMLWSKKTRQY